MVDRFVEELRQAVSAPRLERYRTAGDTDLDMVTNYYWNMTLAEALLCPLGTVEIMLRNTIHDTLGAHFRTDRLVRRQRAPGGEAGGAGRGGEEAHRLAQ